MSLVEAITTVSPGKTSKKSEMRKRHQTDEKILWNKIQWNVKLM